MTEPIPISGYECPVCRYRMTSSQGYSRALAESHVNQPISQPLPKGLVYKNIDSPESFIRHFTGIAVFDPNTQDHSYLQFVEIYSEGSLVGSNQINSRDFRTDLQTGLLKFLTEKEFENFKIQVLTRNLKPIRTTPELEAIVLLSQIPNKLQ